MAKKKAEVTKKTITLSIGERYYLLAAILPARAGIIAMRTATEIREKANYSADEIKKHNIRDTENGGIEFDSSEDVIIELNDVELMLLNGRIAELSANPEFEADHFLMGLIFKIEKA